MKSKYPTCCPAHVKADGPFTREEVQDMLDDATSFVATAIVSSVEPRLAFYRKIIILLSGAVVLLVVAVLALVFRPVAG